MIFVPFSQVFALCAASLTNLGSTVKIRPIEHNLGHVWMMGGGILDHIDTPDQLIIKGAT